MNILTLNAPTLAINPPPSSQTTFRANRETELLTCHIAGTTHRNLHDLAPLLLPEDVFTLRREPENAHDEWAIAIYDERDNHIGYIPRKKNEILARLMDAGVQLGAKLIEKEKLPKVTAKEWVRLNISVFINEFPAK